MRPGAEDARQGRGWYAALARTGLVAKGISFAIVGVLALRLALGDGGKATSREGALQTLAHNGLGKVLLVVLALGFAAYAIWQLVQAYAEPGEEEAQTWARRAGNVGKAAVYAVLTYSTLRLVANARSGGESQNEKAHKTTALVLSWPAGTWLVGIAGAIVLGFGLWNLYAAFTTKFEEEWETGRMGRAIRHWGEGIGVAGYVARGVVFGMIGVFVIRAALNYNPKDAVGLDGALQKLSHASYGPVLLGLTAVGLLCYAIFCLFDARYRDVSAGD